jgi:tetratricopeptide (TPR) repeat protein
MTTRNEELYLEAEADIRNSAYHEAFQKYEAILYDDPTYAPAHNSIGWIYRTQFEDLEKAEMHFRTAIKSDPFYPHPYFHLASVMLDTDRFKELEQHLEHCFEVYTIDKSWIHDRLGMMHEMKGDYVLAIKSYQQAILATMNDDKIKEYQNDINRCRIKSDIINSNNGTQEPERSKPWLFNWR